jgi:uncharacterized protein with NAD-binding domain and iron-sulfur cluster
MAGLTAAWELSRPEHRGQVASVTVYQRGWRLGGKGASSRGVHGRIEEHGLHVWLGYYDNAFHLMRQVYDELDRPTTDPDCPIRTWRDAFVPAEHVGVADRERSSGVGEPWLASFGRNRFEPGDPSAPPRPTSGAAFAELAVALLVDLWTSLGRKRQAPAGVFLTASPRPPGAGTRLDPLRSLADFGDAVRQAEVAAIVAALHALDELDRSSLVGSPVRQAIVDQLAQLRGALRTRLGNDDSGRRLWHLSDLLIACLRGMVADDLLRGVQRYPTIDDLDFRAWLAQHGAGEETLRSPIVNAMYDLVFAYERGDPRRPAFSAGLGLFLASKLFFDYKRSIFWKMRAGMGDVVFAPLYQALRARGVRFEFFTRVHALRLAGGSSVVGAVELARQVRLADPEAGFDPLTRVRDLPCFPAIPDSTQLVGDAPLDAERHDGDRGGEETLALRAGRDFDVLVLATSLGMIPHVAADLVTVSDRWRGLVDHVATVPTQAAQLWLTETEAELGWPRPGATLSGWEKPFDTYSSMSHLLPLEDWPTGDTPRGLAYLCSSLPDDADHDERSVRAAVAQMLEERIQDLWPSARRAGGFRWEVLHGDLAAQFVTAATDPSDRYVQSLPGTARYRLRVDESGFANLVLAGDWTNCGLNAGCIEAAVLSGLQAANTILGRPLMEAVLGSWYPMDRPAPAADQAPVGGARTTGSPLSKEEALS